jgi:hypothetical protein
VAALLIWAPWSSPSRPPADARVVVQSYYAALNDAAEAVNRLNSTREPMDFTEHTKAQIRVSKEPLSRACDLLSAQLQPLADQIPGGGGCPMLLYFFNVYQEESYTPRLGSIKSEAPHLVRRDGHAIVVSTLEGRLADPGSKFKQRVGLVVVPEDGDWKIASINPVGSMNEETVAVNGGPAHPVSEALRQYEKLQRLGSS